jgi:hypothetical protein
VREAEVEEEMVWEFCATAGCDEKVPTMEVAAASPKLTLLKAERLEVFNCSFWCFIQCFSIVKKYFHAKPVCNL